MNAPASDPDEPALTFGTAGLRGPVRDGPGGMNVAAVTRVSWALGRWLTDQRRGGSAVVVGRDARHGSEAFFRATCEVLTAQGFAVIGLPLPSPTPEVAWAVRAFGAAAGVQITASHNPPADNGYKVYVASGAQLISPADREIEALLAAAPQASAITRTPAPPDPRSARVGPEYLARAMTLAPAGPRRLRIALTPLHGVGGVAAVAALTGSGFTDVHVVGRQFDPDPDFPTVAFPNPEEPGAADLVLALAERIDADLVIALDPDADRCALGVRDHGHPGAGAGGWRMLTGDETGSLLGDRVLTLTDAQSPLVATTIVSSELLGSIAAAHGARYERTLTGFKNLVRAGGGEPDGAGGGEASSASGARPGPTRLVFAYEEAIGLCVDPDAVRDKDGISAAVVAAAYAAELKAAGRSLPAALDALYAAHGVHLTAQHAVRHEDRAQINRLLARLRGAPPTAAAGISVTCEDLLHSRPATDALVFRGDGVRVTVRPSGTEPKVKFYAEAVARGPGAPEVARRRLAALLADARDWAA